MIDTNPAITVMNDDDLLACTRELVRKSCATEAELLLHLAELDERRLYAEHPAYAGNAFEAEGLPDAYR